MAPSSHGRWRSKTALRLFSPPGYRATWSLPCLRRSSTAWSSRSQAASSVPTTASSPRRSAPSARRARSCMRSTPRRAKNCGRAATRSRRSCMTAGCPAAGVSCVLGPTTACCTPSVFRSSADVIPALLTLAFFAGSAWAQLPEGPGKEEIQRVCKQCHELERSFSVRQDEEGWRRTLDKMVALGTKVTEQELGAILDYLAKNFPAEELPKLNVNKATAIDLESRL